MEVDIRTDKKAEDEEETGVRKLDGITVKTDTSCKKNKRKFLCPRACSISQDCLCLPQQVSVKSPWQNGHFLDHTDHREVLIYQLFF